MRFIKYRKIDTSLSQSIDPGGFGPCIPLRMPGGSGAHRALAYLAHPHPAPQPHTCTVGLRDRGSAAPGSWGSQMAARSWGQWCCAVAAHSSSQKVHMGTTADPVRGTLQHCQRRHAAAGGRCDAGSGALNTPPHRLCASGRTCH